MNVLIAYERSGVVRRAMASAGHLAFSCDLEPSDDGSQNHFQCDAIDAIISEDWDLVIAHPPCTDLASSGARWFAEKQADGRQPAAVMLFLKTVRACEDHAASWAIENPVGIMSKLYRKPDQIIQPWQFGDPESKATCLWLSNLPPLTPTDVLEPPNYGCKCGCLFDGKLGKYGCPNCCGDHGAALPRWRNQTPSGQNKLGPSDNRATIRSETYKVIANAMADQWTNTSGTTLWTARKFASSADDRYRQQRRRSARDAATPNAATSSAATSRNCSQSNRHQPGR